MKRLKHCGYAMKRPYIREGAKGSFRSLKNFWYCWRCGQMFHQINSKDVSDGKVEKLMELGKRLDEIKIDLLNLKFNNVAEIEE